MPLRLRPLTLALLAALAPLGAIGQVRTDGSLGQPPRALAGPTYAIPESLGRRAGNNLFHSFQTFRIASGETALFTTSTPTIANVFGRVTGGEVSTIDGTLKLQAAAGAPALFLINPAGVMFGPGAVLDVPGAFHVSTADSIRFPDGAFHADPARASTFSSAPPEAFGFLGEQRAAVVLRGAQLANRDAAISIVAGDVTLQDGASLSNRSGAVNVVAIGRQSASVPLQGEPGLLQGTVRIVDDARIETEADEAHLGGAIRVAGGRVELRGDGEFSRTGITSFSPRGREGGAVSVRADEALVIEDGGAIGSSALGESASGAVDVTAGSLTVQGTGRFSGAISTFSDKGRSGDMRISIAGLARIEGADVGTSTFLGTAGALQMDAARIDVGRDGSVSSAGGLSVRARDINVAAGGIFSDGEAGTVDIRADDTLSITGGGRVFLDSLGPRTITARRVLLDEGLVRGWNSYRADSGPLAISATERLELRNESRISVEKSERGISGPLVLNAGALLLDNSTIASETDGTGRGGDIRIAVAGSAELRGGSFISSTSWEIDGGGANGDIVLRARDLAIRDSSIVSDNYARGVRAGDIRVEVEGALLLANSGDGMVDIISTHDGGRQRRSGAGPSGQVVIRAGELAVAGEGDLGSTRISTVSTDGSAGGIDIGVSGAADLRRMTVRTEAPADGDGGAIRLHAGGEVRLRDSVIETSSRGAGRAGDIAVEGAAIRLLASDGQRSDDEAWFSRIASDGLDTGAAGNVALRATGAVSLEGFTSVRATGQFDSDAGRVEIAAGSLSLTGSEAGRSEVNTTTYGSGRGGEIVLRISGPIELRRGGQVHSDTYGPSDAGTVTIDAGSLLVQNDGAAASTRVGTSANPVARGRGGSAGNVTIRLAGDLLLRSGGFITSQAGSGAAGSVRIEAANVSIEGESTDGAGLRASSITAFAPPTSTGELRDLSVTATGSIAVGEHGRISMLNEATSTTPQAIARGILRLAAPSIAVRGGTVDAASIGNVAASDIAVEAGSMLRIDNGRIVTSALGSAGDGGNIRVTAPVMALKTGFVQANATSKGATGGDIALDIRSLLASDESLRIGGDTVAVFQAGQRGANVIQAVAPTGVSGNIQIASPQTDVAGTLVQVKADGLANPLLGKSPCQRTGGSSLALAGRGGLPPTAADPAGSQQAARAGVAAVASVVRLPVTGCGRT